MTFEIESNIEIEFYKPTLVWFADEKILSTKIGLSDVYLIELGYLVSVITNDFGRIIIAPLSWIKSINCVERLSVNQFGEPIEREE